MAGQGHDVTVLTTGGRAGAQRETHGVYVVRLHVSEDNRSFLSNLWVMLRLFFKALKLPKQDIVISMSDPVMMVLPGSVIATFKGAKHVHWCHDLYPDLLPILNYRLWSPLQKILEGINRRALKSCAKVVVIGRCMQAELVKKGIPAAKVKLVPNWYDPVLTRPVMELTDPPLPQKFRILYAGSIARAHPLKTILNAARILNETDHDIEFVFVGEGVGFQKLARERARLGLENIRLLPYQPQERIRALFESGDIHLISMRSDAVGKLVPSKFYSALAIKRPCLLIGPQECEVAKVMEEYQSGITIPHGQAGALAQAIRYLRDNGADWYMLQEGAAKAGQVFTPEASLKAWTALIDGV